jgi:hypothetical protein
MTTRTRTALAALLLGLGVGAAGCHASGSTTPPVAQPRPFDGATYYGQQQRSRLHSAEEARVAACMKQRGFPYRPQALVGGDHTSDANPYGLLTVAQARNDGFGITSSAVDTRPVVDSNADVDTRDGWNAALVGTAAHRVYLNLPGNRQFFYNTDSCATQAVAQLYGADYYRLFNTLTVLSTQVVAQVQNDARYLAAQSRWQRCMTTAGEPAQTLADPPGAISAQLQQAGKDPAKLHTLAGRELALAETDAHCQATADLATAVTTAQTDAEKTLITGHTSDLSALRQLQHQAVTKTAG